VLGNSEGSDVTGDAVGSLTSGLALGVDDGLNVGSTVDGVDVGKDTTGLSDGISVGCDSVGKKVGMLIVG